ncbi:diguanylate cyclase (GGDEF)-like protein [Pseudokineococcus lusitanus]|uniref:Diguanylate cyclase (GGDEF)-like protein n=1 Tax=Pseudokineococcus lusitanus TaxID=763993 RepID=A0A3N1HJZ5_9ACTN|nr:diguanylate cyclase (GGDEF)-like protein [Pseudokineococcus lusitanus]
MLHLRLYLGAAALVAVAYFAVPNGLLRDAAYAVSGLLGVAAVLWGLRRSRPRERAAWWLLAAGQVMFTVADGVFAVYDHVLHLTPFPSPADVVYLAAYPVIALGLHRLVRARPGEVGRGALLDGAVLTLALTLVSWVALAHPLLVSDEPLVARVVSAAYPMADILLLALLVLLVMAPGARTPSFRLLATSMALLLVADTLYAALSAAGDWDDGGLTSGLWIASYTLLGAAALHPSMRELSDPDHPDRPADAGAPTATSPLSRRRLTVLAGAVALAPVTMAVQHLLGAPFDVWALVVSSLGLFGLVVARLATVVGQVVRYSAQRDALRGDLAHAAAHDPLTQLANRGQILEDVAAALHRAVRSGTPVGLLFVDLDHFKAVNDRHGHAVGDEVLREVAVRLRATVRAGDGVGRLGGDEIVVLVEQLASEEALVELAQRVVDALAAPFRTSAGEVVIGASVGVVVEGGGGTDASRLVHDADTAAYRAKASGRNRLEVFDDALRAELDEVARTEAALRRALRDDELLLHYQPVVRAADRRVVGYEALLRWDRPGHGLVAPDAFIPVAERSSLVCDLDRWVLRTATQQLARWRAEGRADARTTVAVNISGRHLVDPALVADVADALAAADLRPGALVLELTETVLVSHPLATTHLERLRALGVAVSIDDFGTGYTSISQLQDLHADTLKIDKSLVWSTSPGAAELVRLVVHAAHAFGLSVVAEGVEDEEQLRQLRQAGCDEVQGYLLGRPGTDPRPAASAATATAGPGRPTTSLPRQASSAARAVDGARTG